MMSKIVFIGDSITKGTDYGGVTTTDTFAYKIGVAAGYAPANIINKGVGGDTSAGVLARLNADVIALAPKVCVLMIGVNDWGANVPINTFKANLAQIKAQLDAANIRLVILTSNLRRGSAAEISGQEAYIIASESIGAPVVDIFRNVCFRALLSDYMWIYYTYPDFIHLSKAGHTYVSDVAKRQLQLFLP